jgi:hypothetical protein
LRGVVDEEGIEYFPHIVPNEPGGSVCEDITNEGDTVMSVNGLFREDDDKAHEGEVEKEFETVARPFICASHKYVSAEVLECPRASEHIPPSRMHFAVLCITPLNPSAVVWFAGGSTSVILIIFINRAISVWGVWSVASCLDVAIFQVVHMVNIARGRRKRRRGRRRDGGLRDLFWFRCRCCSWRRSYFLGLGRHGCDGCDGYDSKYPKRQPIPDPDPANSTRDQIDVIIF